MSDEKKEPSEFDKKIASIKAARESQEPKEEPKPKEEEKLDVDTEKKDSKPSMNWEAAELRIRKIEDFQKTFEGKSGFNPFLWLKDNVWQLKAKFEAGERTEELYNAIMSIPLAQEPSGENLKVESYKIHQVLDKKGIMSIPGSKGR
jgi:hypothetical protein